ncbi:hypothetical protein [Treponema sp.]|uniref:hypothetical protein n=1 Tax=Treponema sp. TaxID=166 RepID=UPI00298D9C45|nr:hypothetical protein [Treponema sp.]MCQ2242346.1 hypothetical protein [Treponema sp.]
MTLQKAMRVRSELKKMASSLTDLLRKVSYTINFKNEKPTEEELQEKREEKNVQLDGHSYEEIVKKQIAVTEAIYDLNVAIEKSNRKGHELLFKETALKSKLAYVDNLIEKERSIKAEDFVWETDYENVDKNGNYKKVKVPVYQYSVLKSDSLGQPLNDLKKSLMKELEAVRDELSAFNATAKIDYEVPEGLL